MSSIDLAIQDFGQLLGIEQTLVLEPEGHLSLQLGENQQISLEQKDETLVISIVTDFSHDTDRAEQVLLQKAYGFTHPEFFIQVGRIEQDNRPKVAAAVRLTTPEQYTGSVLMSACQLLLNWVEVDLSMESI